MTQHAPAGTSNGGQFVSGGGSHPSDAALHRVLGGLTHADLVKAFSVNGLTAKHVKTEPFDIEGTRGVGVLFHLHNQSGQKVGFIRRSFQVTSTGEKHVEHDQFKLSTEYQGKGTAKSLLKNSVELYQKHGISKIKLDAGMDAGRYVWASMGFVANPKAVAQYRDAFSKWVAEHHREHATQAAHDIARMTSMHEISQYSTKEHHLGKQFLMHAADRIPEWRGEMSVKNDNPQFQHFKKKIGL